MKLAEALSIRKDLQKRIKQLEPHQGSSITQHDHPVDYESPMPSFS